MPFLAEIDAAELAAVAKTSWKRRLTRSAWNLILVFMAVGSPLQRSPINLIIYLERGLLIETQNRFLFVRFSYNITVPFIAPEISTSSSRCESLPTVAGRFFSPPRGEIHDTGYCY